MESRELTSFPTLLMFYDRAMGTDFSDFILSFRRSDNKEFYRRYGYYPVGGCFKRLNDIREFILERGPETFPASLHIKIPSFEIDEDTISRLNYDKIITYS